MAYIPVPNTIQAELIFTEFDDVAENTLYFTDDHDPSGSELLALATDLITWWVTYLKPYTGSFYGLVEVKCTDLTTVSSPSITVPASGTPHGDDTGDPLPAQTSLCMSLLTLARGRSYRGRNYVGGFTEASTSGGVYVGSHVAHIEDAYNALFTVADANTAIWTVASRYNGGAPRVTGVATPVSSVRGNAIPATQRRRRPGVGS